MNYRELIAKLRHIAVKLAFDKYMAEVWPDYHDYSQNKITNEDLIKRDRAAWNRYVSSVEEIGGITKPAL